jgi:hypothetical protein
MEGKDEVIAIAEVTPSLLWEQDTEIRMEWQDVQGAELTRLPKSLAAGETSQ